MLVSIVEKEQSKYLFARQHEERNESKKSYDACHDVTIEFGELNKLGVGAWSFYLSLLTTKVTN